ncbi:hypothetical protein U9M48_003451 [Paspalum notatum var. saurae]|uniref:Reverse transcriptase Ty1/copia-type domain-containing protein n=1 Tax=Paspalum notatum var. saurae TaxID=547442 RepID=A0AAQ3PSR9_PASNO
MALVTAELTWLWSLLADFGVSISIPTPLLTGSTCAISIARDRTVRLHFATCFQSYSWLISSQKQRPELSIAFISPNLVCLIHLEFEGAGGNTSHLGANVVTGKWIFKHKFHADGFLARHKARWVVRGFSQQHGIDYDETFRPVVKPTTIRVVLSIAASRAWPIHQLDVKNAFLHGHPHETVYCQQPPGFVDPAAPDHAPRAWYQRFATYIRRVGFTVSTSDTSFFVFKEGSTIAYLLLYVDDIILTASSPSASDEPPAL